MNFDELQQQWRKEMEITSVLKDFSIDKLAACSSEVERGNRFAGFILAGTAIAISLLATFLLLTDGVPKTPPKLVTLIGTPVLLACASWLYFRSVRKPANMDWTLAARISSEREKLDRQVRLARKLPLIFLLPIFMVILIGTLPSLLNNSIGEIGLFPYLFLVGIAVVLLISTWVIRRDVKNKLQPMLDKITKLEDQLRQ